MKSRMIIALCLLFSSLALGQDRYTDQLRNSYRGIIANFNHPHIRPGALIASPSQNNPNYFYHWVRDAGLTMLEIVQLYQLPLKPERKLALEKHIRQWIDFEVQNQNTAIARSNLGEPIFTVIGDIYPHPWGRPQSDGPPTRALAMTNYAFSLIEQGRLSEARKLYRAELPTTAPIKRDLEFIAHYWMEPSFDLWEEVKGNHFFTRMAQRSALLRGAELAQKMNDPGAAAFYSMVAREIEKTLLAHKNDSKGYIVPTLHQVDGWRHKTSELDVSVILAVIYFSLDDGFMGVDDPWVLATARKLEDVFSAIYKINQHSQLAPAIGRYPEDVYTGNGFGEGNPWFLATNAFSEYYCRLAVSSLTRSEAEKRRTKAKSFLDRTIYHSDPGGRMPEQFNRYNGYTQGATDLTWSYISYVRAFRHCHSDVRLLDLEELEVAKPHPSR